MTPGTDNQTLDGISKKWIKQSSTELRAGKYEFDNMRRVYIEKPDGSQRPLTISQPA
jgi:retron-type reverse transcriptase